MIGDHHGRTPGRATLLVRAVDDIFGTYSAARPAAATEIQPGRQALKATCMRDMLKRVAYASQGTTRLGPYLGRCRQAACSAVGQRLAAQAPGDAGGLTDSGRGGVRVAEAEQILSLVEQAVGEVVGGAVLSQAADSGRE
jgi:hypothetical protein